MALGALPFASAGSIIFISLLNPVFVWLEIKGISQILGGVASGMIAGIIVWNGLEANINSGLIAGIVVGGAYVLRLYYYPIHLILLWPKIRGQSYTSHPVFWDDLCPAPFIYLSNLLVAFAEEDQKKESQVERLIESYPSQRQQALRAKVILLARKSSRTNDLSRLVELLAPLPEGKKGYLAETIQVKDWANTICRLQARLNTINRAAFREMIAELLVKEIENFRHRVTDLHEPLAIEFRDAATRWLVVAQDQLTTARRTNNEGVTSQVFKAGEPVRRDQEAFVLRYDLIGELEQQIMLSTDCPGVVLYSRRRMGKSTILRNLTGFLPLEVLTVNVSMLNPSLVASLPSFARTLAEQIQTQARELKLNEPLPNDLLGLFRFLTAVNDKLVLEQKRLLLAVDEYEALDAKIGAGVFPQDLPDTLRESIQTHRRLTWIFAGSHEITELPHAAWTSALVSARTIEVPCFTPAETRLLLTEPLKHSELWRGNEDKRPRFDAGFWGTEEGSGIDFIHAQAGGWPHLVQLIAETLVDLVNEEEAHAVTPALMQRALDKAIVRGHNVLYELLHRECQLPGEWDYLERFKRLDSQPVPDDEAIARSLRRRELMTVDGSDWSLRVPLMLRWLRVRG